MRTYVSMGVALCSLVLGLALATCGPNPPGTPEGDASVRITPSGGTQQSFDHEAGRSEIQVTPPAGGTFTASFTYQDPSMQLSIRVDGNHVAEGARVTFPVQSPYTTADMLMTLSFQGRTYSSDQPGAGGDITLEILKVTEDAVDFRGSFNVTLAAQDGTTAAVVGFLEAHEGDTSAAGEDGGR